MEPLPSTSGLLRKVTINTIIGCILDILLKTDNHFDSGHACFMWYECSRWNLKSNAWAASPEDISIVVLAHGWSIVVPLHLLSRVLVLDLLEVERLAFASSYASLISFLLATYFSTMDLKKTIFHFYQCADTVTEMPQWVGCSP